MPHDEENKVFDVSKPSRVTPDPTSKPVIVGHQPTLNDPMVKTDASGSSSVPIHINFDQKTEEHNPVHDPKPESALNFDTDSLSVADAHEHNTVDPHNNPQDNPTESSYEVHENNESSKADKTDDEPHFTSINSLLSHEKEEEKQAESSLPPPPTPGTVQQPVNAPLPVPRGAGPYHRLPRILGGIILIALVLAIIGFLLIDLGLVKSDIKLPFHIFNKQSTSVTTLNPAPAPTPKSAVSTAPSIPSGFSRYKLGGTNLSFAYPTAWGNPAVTNDPGFTKRGGTNSSDGVHAYIVKFASNKDIEVSAVSSKYLPPTRKNAQYYDFLQWCTGTNDGKFYQQVLLFNTENKFDVPSTVSCSQGPLINGSKLDEQTLLQSKIKDAVGADLGDVYTKNLNDINTPVLRVKDTTSANTENIKKLLNTVKTSS